MPDNAIICAKLEVMLGYYQELRQVVEKITIDNYKKDILVKRTIEREIQLIVESATDINNMLLKKINKGPAKDYFNSFIELAENNIIEMDFALQIAPSTGLRNILVHEYNRIDDNIVFNSVGNIIKYYKRYFEEISGYLGCV